MNFPSCDQLGYLISEPNASAHFWVEKSKSINLKGCSFVVAAMYLPSGDQRGEKSPLDSGKAETRLDPRSMVLIGSLLLISPEPKTSEFASGDQFASS